MPRGPLSENLLEAPRISSNSELLAYRDSLRRAYARVHALHYALRSTRQSGTAAFEENGAQGEEDCRFIRDGI